MKATVIMGIYNCEKTLENSLESLLRQTYQDFDIILCEDGSTDQTYDVAENYQKEYPDRILLLRNEKNKGLAYSLNRCLEKATGEYIIRMDADDVSRSDRFEKQIRFLEEHPEYALVGCNAALFDNRGVWGVRITPALPEKKDFLRTSSFIHPAIIMRRRLLDEVEGYSDAKETLRAEDYDLFMRIYAHGYAGANIQELLLFYREDTGNFGRRKYRYRLDEAKVRYRGFKSLSLFPVGYMYVLKPLVVGLVPQSVLRLLRMESIV